MLDIEYLLIVACTFSNGVGSLLSYVIYDVEILKSMRAIFW